MSEETGPGRESYLTGGNLLNGQDRIAREKEHHSVGDAHAADPAETGRADAADPVEDGTAAHGGGHIAGEGWDDDAAVGGEGWDDDGEHPVPGAAIPDQPADSITEEQNTEGGGTVPPGSADAGHTVRRRW